MCQLHCPVPPSVWMCPLARCYIVWNFMPVCQAFCNSLYGGADWGSRVRKKFSITRIDVNFCENDLLPLVTKDNLSSQGNMPYGWFKIGFFFVFFFFWEIKLSEKAEARLLEFMLLGSCVISIFYPVITPFLYLSCQVWHSQ